MYNWNIKHQSNRGVNQYYYSCRKKLWPVLNNITIVVKLIDPLSCVHCLRKPMRWSDYFHSTIICYQSALIVDTIILTDIGKVHVLQMNISNACSVVSSCVVVVVAHNCCDCHELEIDLNDKRCIIDSFWFCKLFMSHIYRHCMRSVGDILNKCRKPETCRVTMVVFFFPFFLFFFSPFLKCITYFV